MRTFEGFSHYAVSPSWRRPPAGGEESLQTPRHRCDASSVPCAAKMRYPMGALRRDCRRAVGPGSSQDRRWAIGSAGERLVHTEEVTGSIPVSPTDVSPGQKLHGQLSSYVRDGSFCRIGRNLGDRVPRLVPERGKQMPGERTGSAVRPV